MDRTELKPCPFCGKPVKRVRGYNGLNFFKCSNSGVCGAVMSFDNDYYNHYPEQAIKAFNRRDGAIVVNNYGNGEQIKNEGHMTINIGGKNESNKG